MLASFTSILPSGLGFNSKDDRERERERLDKEREREREKGEREIERDAGGQEDMTPRANDNDGKLKESSVDEHGVKKRRERNPNETFIVVRPPPSMSNHPLNLQIQLVPPQAKERSTSGASSVSGPSSYGSRPSGEYASQATEEPDTGDSQSYAQSVRSNRSDTSPFYASSSASMSSIASTASTASTASGRRMIVPLYNLSAHNVMTNTVLDAGTDAKVAKFHKRGMEILALAMLECVEVWPSYARSGLGPGHVAFLSASSGGHSGAAGTMLDHEGLLVTPTSSAISLSSAGSHPPLHTHYPHPQSHPYVQPSISAPAAPPGPGTPQTPTQAATSSGRGAAGSAASNANVTVTPTPSSGAKRIFGKIFKKRDSQVSSPVTIVSSSGSHARTGSGSIDVRFLAASSSGSSEIGQSSGLTLGAGKRRSVNVSSPATSHFTVPPSPVPPGSAGGNAGGSSKDQPQLQPAVLGIQPTLSAPVFPPTGRPTRYVWIVRKWLKGGDGGLLGEVMRGVTGVVGSGINMAGLGPGPVIGQLQNQGPDGGPGDVGVEVRFEWVRGQSKNQEKRNAKRNAQLQKRGSGSTQEDRSSAGQRSRRSLGVERPGDRKEESRSRTRTTGSGRPATATGVGTSRVSGESRRSGELERDQGQTFRDSRTNSLTSAMSEDLRQRAAMEEDEEESDPEDSETPWVCTLFVSNVPTNAARLWEHGHRERDREGSALSKKESRRSHLNHAAETSATDQSAPQPPPPPPKPSSRELPPGTLLRVKVGALSPAPHHPKVLAQLKVPYPLPDIEVTRGRIRRRVLTPEGVARPLDRVGTFGVEREKQKSRSGLFGSTNGGGGGGSGGEGGEGLVLTAEEIKDVLSCTAFWIVVREGFGGVGKVNRKGDGWRIRG